MLRQKDKENKLYYNFVIDEYVPEDHILRLIDKHVSFDFIRKRVKHLYSHTGQPAVDPVVLIKMLLIGYLFNIKSERQLVKEIQVNLAYRWFINYDIDETIPDHSTISQTRKRKFKDSTIFQELFDEIVNQCKALGLIRGETIITDSTHIKANASFDSLVEVVKSTDEYLKELELNAQENKSENNIKNEKDKGKRYSNDTHRSKTDPDSRLMGRRGKPGGLHYLEHRSIDLSGYITDVHVTPSNIQDNDPYMARIRRQKWTFKFPLRNAVADRSYGIGYIYKELTEMGINAYIAQYTRQDKREGMFDHDDFIYLEDDDCYICPNEKRLTRRGNKPKDDLCFVYHAGKKECNNSCPYRGRCTTSQSDRPRCLKRHIYQDYIDDQISKRGNQEWKRFMNKRKTLIEGSFADAKNNHGLSRARMRGLTKVQEQSLMTAVVQNIKKMIKDIKKNEKGKESRLFCNFLLHKHFFVVRYS